MNVFLRFLRRYVSVIELILSDAISDAQKMAPCLLEPLRVLIPAFHHVIISVLVVILPYPKDSLKIRFIQIIVTHIIL